MAANHASTGADFALAEAEHAARHDAVPSPLCGSGTNARGRSFQPAWHRDPIEVSGARKTSSGYGSTTSAAVRRRESAAIFKRTEPAVKARAREPGLKFPTINQLRRRARGAISRRLLRELSS